MGDTAAVPPCESCAPLENRFPDTSPDPAVARLHLLIQDIISDQGLDSADSQRVRDLTRNELLKLYEHPKVPQLEATLSKRVTEEEARHILFFPDHQQAAYYQRLIANPPKGSPTDHPQRAVQIPHLTLLYLQHWKRWEFVTSFVLEGGLHTLCSLFRHDNPVVRMKAITTLVSITAHQEFDWFLPPQRLSAIATLNGDGGDRGVRGGNNTTIARLHRALLDLRSDPAFISGLIANSWGGCVAGDSVGGPSAVLESEEEGTKLFPGVCLMCLELLAMWLSWVRALHTADGTLRLSRSLFGAIKEWGGNEDEDEWEKRWGKAQWIPILPANQHPRHRQPISGNGGELGINGGDMSMFAEGSSVDTSIGAAAATAGSRSDGVAVATEVEPRTTSTIEVNGVDCSPVGEHWGEITQVHRGERQGIFGEDPKGREVCGTKVRAGASSGGATGRGKSGEGRAAAHKEVEADADANVDAAEMMLRAKREERAKVLELVGKLVADFGRFPLADQEWEGVEEGGAKSDPKPLKQEDEMTVAASSPAEGGLSLDQGDDDACCPAGDGGDGGGDDGDNSGGPGDGSDSSKSTGAGRDQPLAVGDRDTGEGVTSSEKAQPSSRCEDAAWDNAAQSSLSSSIRRALALKVDGNESFGKGNMQAARKAYTAALDILDAANVPTGVTLPQTPPRQKSATKESSGDSSTAEATALRGVLHRNRAAVALRLFDSRASAAASAKEERTPPSSHHHPSGKTAAVNISDIEPGGGSCDLRSSPACNGPGKEPPAQGDHRVVLPPGKENERSNEAEDARCALEESLALLEGCESDCLKAIEVDAGDKKARLRLDRCRELRRRCYRTGLASSAVGRGGRFTSYARQDERLQERKAELVAKILARTEGSHEILSGAARSHAVEETALSSTTPPPVPAAGEDDTDTPSSGSGNESGSGRSGASPIDEKGELGVRHGEGGKGTKVCGDNGYGGGGRLGETARASVLARGRTIRSPSASSSPPAPEDNQRVAPREGGELRRSNVRSSSEIATPAANAATTSHEQGGGLRCREGEVVTAEASPEGDGANEIYSDNGLDRIRGGVGGRGGGGGGGGGRVSHSPNQSETRRKVVESQKVKKREKCRDKTGASTTPSRPPINTRDSQAAVRRALRRRLEQAAVRAAATSSRTKTAGEEEENVGGMEDGKEVWDILKSVPSSCSRYGSQGSGSGSLEKLFGDGITVETLIGVAHGLRYACRIDACAGDAAEGQKGGGECGGQRHDGHRTNTKRASDLFLELARVKRVGLMSAMCSAKDMEALEDVWCHIRRHLLLVDSDGTGEGGGGSEEEASRGGGDKAESSRDAHAFEVAVATLGLRCKH